MPDIENILNLPGREWQEMTAALADCRSCPRNCGVNRLVSASGYCRTGAGFPVSSVVAHHGEEPALSGINGICNIFFAHCNLQCLFCQNHQISDNRQEIGQLNMEAPELLKKIYKLLDGGCHALGFVTPSHVVPQTIWLIRAILASGRTPVFVYNTGSYDTVTSIRSLEGMIGVYLPDIKYMDGELALKYSGAADYPGVARAAILEMYRQKGASLILDPDGQAVSGMIVRHLVLPGHVENSLKVLRFISEELSNSVWISLMSQYYPAHRVAGHSELGRKIFMEEYRLVVRELERLGFTRGWIQDEDSAGHYLPDFNQNDPFNT